MKIFIALLFISSINFSFAQKRDTVYFDNNWKETNTPDYSFYRVITHEGNKLNVEDHYRSGNIQMQGVYSSLEPKEVKDGHFIYYTVNGIKTRDENFSNGLREGDAMTYDTLEKYTYKMHYKKGKLQDTMSGYYVSGALRRTELYAGDSLLSGKCYDEQGNIIAFIPRMTPMEFPGGDRAMMSFVQSYMIYPNFARENGIQGRVFVSFIVETDGSITEIKIKKGIAKLLDDAAMDIVQQFPLFKPATIEGNITRQPCVLPIMFKLTSK